MKKYVKKPVVIEAILWDGQYDTFHELRKWNDQISYFYKTLCDDYNSTALSIPTLEGNMKALEGDYIIKGVKGEIYPCKPDIFEETYSEV